MTSAQRRAIALMQCQPHIQAALESHLEAVKFNDMNVLQCRECLHIYRVEKPLVVCHAPKAVSDALPPPTHAPRCKSQPNDEHQRD